MRFRIRALVLLVLFLGMLLGIVVVTRENRRLRTALAASEKEVASLRNRTIVSDYVVDLGIANGRFDVVTFDSIENATAQSMPNGPAVFAGRQQ
jgi:hypothetical protein